VGVKAVSGTSFPLDGVSMVSCHSLADVASCRTDEDTGDERHAGRVARVVVQPLEKRRLLRKRVLDVDISNKLYQFESDWRIFVAVQEMKTR
jgi:hypothetical protein